MVALKLLPYAGWPLAALVFWLWLGTRDDLAAEVERCNADKLASIAQAQEIAREASNAAHADRIRQLQRDADLADRAREIAELARLEAESRPVETRTIIREIADADPESCLNVAIDPDLIDSLR